MEEAVNTFRFGHIVNQIQLDCSLAEHTAVPNSHGIGCALQWTQIKSYSIRHFVNYEGTRLVETS